MRVRWLLLFVLVFTALTSPTGRSVAAAPPSPDAPIPGPCVLIDQPDTSPGHDAKWKICAPVSGGNGDVVVWAHGYVFPDEAPTFQDEVPGTPPVALPLLVQSLGYIFAATTYGDNGLVVLEAKDDLLNLAAYVESVYPPPTGHDRKTYLVGASMGGLITTQLAEQSTGVFDGALAACGISDLRRLIDYWGDFRVVFDYFYPGVLASLPPLDGQRTAEAWRTIYAPLITQAILATDPDLTKARQLLAVTRAPVATPTPEAALETILSVLSFSVFSADDAATRLKGNPFDNRWRWYWGSNNDLLLNRTVARFTASSTALAELQNYGTSGRTRIPLVMPHTTADEIVPFSQTLRYWLKAQPPGGSNVTPLPVARFGHCRFTSAELVLSFALLVFQTTGRLPVALQAEVARLDLTGFQAELAAQLATFQAAEARDAAMQSAAPWTRVHLPLLHK